MGRYWKTNMSDLGIFVDNLLKEFEVLGPIKENDYHVFGRINSFGDMDLDFQNTLYPPKKFLLPPSEELFYYDAGGFSQKTLQRKRILLGIRPCDSNAILPFNQIFLEEPTDPLYKSRIEDTLILAFVCKESGEMCFCESLDTQRAKVFDLQFFQEGDSYIVEVGSERGKSLLDSGNFEETDYHDSGDLECKTSITREEIDRLDNNFNHPLWEEAGRICLSCTACVVTCPSCTCFNVEHIPSLDQKSTQIVRRWSSCQLKDFSRVAGDYSFRDDRSHRVKHRIYHKFKYFHDRFGMYMCVGCGRCITQCPTHIDMLGIMKNLQEGSN